MSTEKPGNDAQRQRGGFARFRKLAWFLGTAASVPLTIAFVVTARPAVLYAESAPYDAGPPVCDRAAIAACELDGGDGGCTLRGASGRCVFEWCREATSSSDRHVLTCVLPVPPAPPPLPGTPPPAPSAAPSAPTDQGQPTDPEVGGCSSSPTTGLGDGLALASVTIGLTALAWRRRRS
jgi:hypothetical protein